MNHGAPEYHSRGFETHKYVYSRLTAFGHLPLPYMTGGQLTGMHCYKNPQVHQTLCCHSISNIHQNSLHHLFSTTSQFSKKGKGKLKGLAILDKEIDIFCKSMKPTSRANQEREDVVSRIRKAVESCILPVQVEVFGSFKTGLYLPSSDIDIVVFHECPSTPFDVLKEALVKDQVCEEDKILVLYNATVPIIKLTDRLTEVKIDIGFNISNAPKSAGFIQKSLNEWPFMRELLMVLKQLLIEQDLNEVYTGGISSYSLTLLILFFFRILPKSYTRHSCGILLLDFLRYYGFHFDYRYYAICVNRSSCYLKPFPSEALVIQDPLCPTNDVARGSYRFSLVQAAFKNAYNDIIHSIQSVSLSGVSSQNWFVLGSIVRTTKPPDTPPPLFYDQSGQDLSFNAFSSDDSATPSSSNIDFEECDVDRVTLDLRGIIVSPVQEVTSPRMGSHPRPAESTDSNPSSSSSSSEIALASDDEETDCSRFSDSGISGHDFHRFADDTKQSPIIGSSDCFSFLNKDVPQDSSQAEIIPRGRISVSVRCLEGNSKRPSYRDVVQSMPFRMPNQGNQSIKSHSCSDIMSESPRDQNLGRAHLFHPTLDASS